MKDEVAEIERLRSLVSSNNDLVASQEKAVGDVKKLISEFQGIGNVEETVGYALPLGEEVTSALSQLQSIARVNGVSISSFTVRPLPVEVSKEPVVKRLGTLEVEVTAEGSYAGMKALLRSLETNVRIANVSEFVIDSKTGVGIKGEIYIMRLQYQIFYQDTSVVKVATPNKK